MNKVWFDKYRPVTTEGYVFKNDNLKSQIATWVKEQNIPHLLFSGPAGTGKTTLAKVIFNELDADKADILEINASSDNGVDYIRDTTTNFVSTMSFSGGMRYVLLDEADYLSPNAQAALRGVMERFINTSRFILTCNYPSKIIPALHSRVQSISIDTLEKPEFAGKMAEILMSEDVKFDADSLQTYIDAYYPDMRKCINEMQSNSSSGELVMPDTSTSSKDYMLEMVALFRNKQFEQARKLVCKQAAPEEYEQIFRFLYENVEFWGEQDPVKTGQAIVTIRNGLVNHTLVADPEINLAACLCDLELVQQG
jgi:replication factor C small subunit